MTIYPRAHVAAGAPDDAPEPDDPQLEQAMANRRALQWRRAFRVWRESPRVQLVCALWVLASALIVWQLAPTVEWEKGPFYVDRSQPVASREELRRAPPSMPGYDPIGTPLALP